MTVSLFDSPEALSYHPAHSQEAQSLDYETLRVDVAGAIARITLGRAAAGNRVGTRLLSELRDATERFGANDGVALVLLEGDGDDFCVGWEEEARAELLASSTVDPFGCLAALACPVLVAVQGRAHSAGLELALAADIRVCGSDARFALPEVGQGLLPLAGGGQRLPRIVGRSRATAMLLLGDELDAEAAYSAGLVSRVVAPDRLRAEAQALAERIASRGPLGLRYAKQAVLEGVEMSLDQALRYELDLSVILQTTDDRAEGVRAFLEKRPPHFEGR